MGSTKNFCVLGVSILVSFAMPQLSSAVEETDPSQIGENVVELGTAIEEAKSNFSEINRQIGELKKKIDALKGDLVRLEDGTSIVRKGTPSSNLLKDDLDKLNAILKAANDGHDQAIAQLDEIYEALASIRADKKNGHYGNDLHGFLRQLIDTLTAYLKDSEIIKAELQLMPEANTSLRKSLDGFYNSLRVLNEGVSGPPSGLDVVARMGALTASLNAFTPKTFKDLPGSAKAAGDLAKRMEALSDDYVFAAAGSQVDKLTKRADDMKKAITDSSKQAKRVLKETDAAVAAFNGLTTEIDKLGLEDAGLVVRVKEAWFGDTYPLTIIQKRWCNATAFMRKSCNRKPNCTLSASYQTEVCGYNPAPSAEPENRGVLVDYDCIRNIDANFDDQHNLPQSGSGVRLSKSRGEYVVLRANGSLYCAASQ